MDFVQGNGTARALRDMNIRGGVPSVRGSIVSHVAAGETIGFAGWVTDGENVSGNAKWFKTEAGTYFWSGNVEVLPEPAPLQQDNMLIDQFRLIVPGLALSVASGFLGPLNEAMDEFEINTPLRMAGFIAQTAHESGGYVTFVENLNYSAQSLTRTWPTRFTPIQAAVYARQPERIANRAYANRNGNGNEASGDGWKYRGRGVIQITFRANYEACGIALGVDLAEHPELLESPRYAFRSGAWFWNSRHLNALADADDFVAITKKINGGINGLPDRQMYYRRAKTALGI
ncbi:MAG: glycoside hydrolase family 19 protein [bacterium]|nr:glycoside hydrolase family 19 protein [bacterium]